jgi:branched-chain amino acid aminotransferase
LSEPLAYLNGQLLPASQASIPIYDAGFVLGATVTEQLRTFRGEIFRLPEHLARLGHSLEIAGIKPNESLVDLAEISARLMANNRALVNAGDDLGLSIFITPGPYAALAEGHRAGPTVGLHTYCLPFHLWVDAYDRGVALATTGIQQVPAACWPSELKCRSRMHYFLADKQAATNHSGARALLLDENGFVSETSTANVVLWRADEGFVSPPRSQVLPGISLQVLIELAGRLELPFVERQILPSEVATADEVLLTSTPNCLLPVTQFNGQAIGSGRPGEVFRRLTAAWNEMVELDIAAQAKQFAQR